MTSVVDGLSISTNGNVTAGNLVTGGNITGGGNVLTTGLISASGNVSGAFILGNGSLLTGMPAAYTNSNVATYLSSGTVSTDIKTTANISATGNILSTGFMSSTGNAIHGNILTAGLISATANITSNNITVGTSLAVGATTPTGTAGQIVATNSITAFYSDRRLKENIQPIPNALDKVDQLSGVTYTQNKFAEQFGYNDYSSQVGVIAQEVQEVLPEVVKLAPFDMGADGTSRSGEHYLTVQYEKIVPLLVEAIKELRAEVNKLKGGK